jgi:hypothetical protein
MQANTLILFQYYSIYPLITIILKVLSAEMNMGERNLAIRLTGLYFKVVDFERIPDGYNCI